jgi:hypothetical protein
MVEQGYTFKVTPGACIIFSVFVARKILRISKILRCPGTIAIYLRQACIETDNYHFFKGRAVG